MGRIEEDTRLCKSKSSPKGGKGGGQVCINFKDPTVQTFMLVALLAVLAVALWYGFTNGCLRRRTSRRGRKSTVTVEISRKDSKPGTLIINIPEPKNASMKKTASVKFNKVPSKNSLIVDKSSEKNIKQLFEGASRNSSDGETDRSSDEAAYKSCDDTNEKPYNKVAYRSSEEPIEKSFDEVANKSSKEVADKQSALRKGFERAIEKLSGRVSKKASEGTAKESSEEVAKHLFDGLDKKLSEEVAKKPSVDAKKIFAGVTKPPPQEIAHFSQKISVHKSAEKVVYPATTMRNSESFMEEISTVENSKSRDLTHLGELNTPTRVILGLFIVLAIALWYGFQNGRFKAFLTPALRGLRESESSSAYDDASIRYHDILPFDAEPYDDTNNPTD